MVSHGPPPCAATHDNGMTEFTDVQEAVNAAPVGGTVKVAGTCTGVKPTVLSEGTITQTVYISKSLTLEGGYTPTDWNAEPDNSVYPTILDANDQGRVVVLHDEAGMGNIQVTLNHLTLQDGLANSMVLFNFKRWWSPDYWRN